MKNGIVKVVVPARLGSQRVKVKSLRLLNGRPLIEYILNALKQTRFLNDIYINSDSDFFREIAIQNDVKFYKRNADMATSKSMIDDYLYDFMKNEECDYLAVVTPTNPFVSSENMDAAWQYYANNETADTLISAEKVQTHCFYRGEALNFSRIGKLPRSQDIEPVWALNFAIAIYDCKKFKANYENLGWGVFTGNLCFYETDGYGVDIDYEDDFQFAELVARFIESGQEFKAEYSELVQHLISNNIETSN